MLQSYVTDIVAKDLVEQGSLDLIKLLMHRCPLELSFVILIQEADNNDYYRNMDCSKHSPWHEGKMIGSLHNRKMEPAGIARTKRVVVAADVGGSGVGGVIFMGVGPLDANLKARNSTWLQKADLIFVDLPVGVGFSYVEDPSLLARTDSEVVADATELLKALTVEIPTLQTSPLFVVGESYGGKLATMIGISVARAIHGGTLKLNLGGVALGDSWISPGDFAVFTSIFIMCFLLNGEKASGATATSADSMERWGYVEVCRKAHLFWWFYKSPQRVSSPAKPWPTVLCLQGGPEA